MHYFGNAKESVMNLCYIYIRYAGQVGYLYANMKNATEAQIGDTLYHVNQPVEPLPGFKLAEPVVNGTSFLKEIHRGLADIIR